MLSSLQALSLIEPPLPRNLPDACLLCCSTLKITSHALDNMHNRRAAHAPAAAVQPALYAVQPLSPALGSLSITSLFACTTDLRQGLILEGESP